MHISTVGELKEFISNLNDDTKVRISEGMHQYPIIGYYRTTVSGSYTPHTVTSIEFEACKDS